MEEQTYGEIPRYRKFSKRMILKLKRRGQILIPLFVKENDEPIIYDLNDKIFWYSDEEEGRIYKAINLYIEKRYFELMYDE